MALSESHIAMLLAKKMTGELTAEEVAQLEQWRNTSPAMQRKYSELTSLAFLQQKQDEYEEAVLRSVKMMPPAVNRPGTLRSIKPVQRWWRYAGAVILIAGLVTALVKYIRPSKDSMTQSTAKQTDILPGKDRAILTLSDGSTITLDTASNGAIAQEGNAAIVKLNNGEIIYKQQGQPHAAGIKNTLRTPRGGQFRFVMQDGTKVWMNAASSVTYPVVFTGNVRAVSITGEVYFEVAGGKLNPFIVDVAGKSTIQVLGTSFNVNAYPEDNVSKTTLIEGSIKVNAGQQTVLLQPRHQAMVALQTGTGNKENITVTKGVDVEQVVAWKNGFFNLHNASLQQVMLQVERWYDISVKYEGTIRPVNFQGEINREVKLSSLLEWFASMGIHSRLEGKTLILNAQ